MADENAAAANKPPAAGLDADKQRLLRLSEISLLLDTYDDIFSDFDPRPYSQRTLSDDFLYEAKKAARDKTSGDIELTFMIPALVRDKANEALIRKRLKDHFAKHRHQLKKEIDAVLRQGMAFVLAGFALMAATTYILFAYTEKSLFLNFLIVLLEPGGWFFLWEGLDTIIFRSKQKTPDLEFYEKMARCEISFTPY